MTDIPGFPSIDHDYQSSVKQNHFRTLSTKHTSVNKVKNTWSAIKTSKNEGIDDTFYQSIMNSTKAGEDDYSYPVVSANSSIIGSKHMRMSTNPRLNTAVRVSADGNPNIILRDSNAQPNINLRDFNNISF